MNKAFTAMRDLHTGIATYINAPTIGAEVHLPFGGTKSTPAMAIVKAGSALSISIASGRPSTSTTRTKLQDRKHRLIAASKN